MKRLVCLLPFFLLISCSVNKLLPIGAQTAKDGSAVAQKGIDIYTVLSQQNAIDESQQDVIKILTNPDPAKMSLPHTELPDFDKELKPRIMAYRSLLKVYQEFGLLTDNKYSNDTKAATSALETCYKNVKSLPKMSSGLSGLISDASGSIEQSIQAGQVKKQNEALYKLTKIYLELWNEDEVSWNKYIDKIYTNYAAGLSTVPSKLYDMAKVKAAATEPYTDDTVLLLLYRVKQRNAVIQQKIALKQQLTDYGKALTLLNSAHAELSKDNCNVADVNTALNNIETLLKTK